MVKPAADSYHLVMAKLSVNVNKVATLRNTRNSGFPSVVHVAQLALEAGAAGITVHPRPDQRHIRPGDVRELSALLAEGYPSSEFNIEGNPFYDYMAIVRQVRPTQCTLVPDEPSAATSNHGWPLEDAEVLRRLEPIVRELKGLGCRVSLFVDAVGEAAMRRAAELGADRVELYTEPYATAFAGGDAKAAEPFAMAAVAAKGVGLGVNAGHDLNLANLPVLVKAIPFLAEVSIGHALVGDALEWGMGETVRRYVAAARGG